MTHFNRREFLAGAAGLVAGGLVGQVGTASAQVKAKPGDRDLLVVVDVQNDFIPGGALPVKEGDQIVPLINTIAAKFPHVILTQDWHTPGHTSFASAHGGKKPFERLEAQQLQRRAVGVDQSTARVLDRDAVGN